MKTLLVLRHAKAKRNGWADYDRPLTRRGKRDAPHIGEWVAQMGLTPDLIVASGAKRAAQTARLAAEAAGYAGEVMLSEALYDSDPERHLEVLRGLPDNADVVMLVGHNPAFEELVEILTGETVTLATAALAQIELDLRSWAEVAARTGRLKGVYTPPVEGRGKAG